MNSGKRYRITLRAAGAVDDGEATRRLRMALKNLGRAYGLCCLGVEELPDGKPSSAPPSGIAPDDDDAA